jgi:hypothetical protein
MEHHHFIFHRYETEGIPFFHASYRSSYPPKFHTKNALGSLPQAIPSGHHSHGKSLRGEGFFIGGSSVKKGDFPASPAAVFTISPRSQPNGNWPNTARPRPGQGHPRALGLMIGAQNSSKNGRGTFGNSRNQQNSDLNQRLSIKVSKMLKHVETSIFNQC